MRKAEIEASLREVASGEFDILKHATNYRGSVAYRLGVRAGQLLLARQMVENIDEGKRPKARRKVAFRSLKALR